jgi:ribosome biogenesis protein Nip4
LLNEAQKFAEKLDVDFSQDLTNEHNRFFTGTHKFPLEDVWYTKGFVGQKKPRFVPSVYFLDEFLSKSPRVAVINKKSAWLFLCGRDVLEDSIISITHKSGSIIVKDENGVCLGIARIERDILKNTFDKGWLLRREFSR